MKNMTKGMLGALAAVVAAMALGPSPPQRRPNRPKGTSCSMKKRALQAIKSERITSSKLDRA